MSFNRQLLILIINTVLGYGQDAYLVFQQFHDISVDNFPSRQILVNLAKLRATEDATRAKFYRVARARSLVRARSRTL